MPADPRPLRIALVAPPMLTVPPKGYAGTERVIAALADELTSRGHTVTLFAAGDSDVACELVPTVPQSLWSASELPEDLEPYFALTVARVWREHERFDVIHSHLEAYGLVFARYCPTPVVTTLHGRVDLPGLPDVLAQLPEIPLVSISDNQRRWFPNLNWVGTVHHGLPLASITYSERPGGYLALVGRMSSEKGIAEAIQLARATGMELRVAAKMRHASERQMYREVLEPAVREGVAEYLGEVGPVERDALYAGAYATLMLGGWPEPFGLVAIESLAAGTPIIARRAGALPEIVEQGVDGFLVDDLMEAELAFRRVPVLDRRLIRQRALARFSPARMADRYERIYRRVIEEAAARRGATMPLTAAAPPPALGVGTRSERAAIDVARSGVKGFETLASAWAGDPDRPAPVMPAASALGPHARPATISTPVAQGNGRNGGNGFGNARAATPNGGEHRAADPHAGLDAGPRAGRVPRPASGDAHGGLDGASHGGTGNGAAGTNSRAGGSGGEAGSARRLVPMGPGRPSAQQEERMHHDDIGRADPIAWRALDQGMPVEGSNGEEIGTVQDVLADDDKDIFHGIVIEHGGRRVLVSQDAIRQLTESGVRIALDDDQVDQLPTFDEESKQPL